MLLKKIIILQLIIIYSDLALHSGFLYKGQSAFFLFSQLSICILHITNNQILVN